METTYRHELKIDGHTVGVFTYPQGSQAVCISDEEVEHYRIMLFSNEHGAVSVRVDLEWSDDRPGELAHYTDECRVDCTSSDVLEINDTGLFTAVARASTSSKSHLSMGLTLQLPASAVPAVRRGIEIARTFAAKTTASEA